MKVLVTGANGFIGSAVMEALLQAGHEVVACARSARNLPSSPNVRFCRADLRTDTAPRAWAPRLQGVSAVVNCAGILREQRPGDFQTIHEQAPAALLEACADAGVQKFVQLSALGGTEDGEFIASKHRFDRRITAGPLPATVIRPAVVLSSRGSYGGTSMLRALAALPGVLLLPGRGEQRLQPVLLEDLAALVLACLSPSVASGEVIYAVGPQVLSLREYLLSLRAWLRFQPPRLVFVPRALVRLAAWLGERLGAGPLGQTITTMLEHDNVAPPQAAQRTQAITGFACRSVTAELSTAPSFVQDRWHARLYLLRPVLWLVLVVVWLLSAVAGFAAAPAAFEPVLTQLGLPLPVHQPLVWATSALDLVLAVLLLLRWRVRLVLLLMALSVLGYTLWLGAAAPALWLEPLGGLLKNLPVMLVLLVFLVLEDGR